MNSTFSLLTICFHNAYFPSVCLPILYLFKLQFFLIQFIFRNCQVLGKTGNKINHKTVSPCNCYFQQLLRKGCVKHTRYKINTVLQVKYYATCQVQVYPSQVLEKLAR